MDAGSSGLSGSSKIQQLAFLPLAEDHAGNDVIESDRMLMVSGVLSLASGSAVSSALYDGANWIPFLTTATRSGAAGYVASLVFSAPSFRLGRRELQTLISEYMLSLCTDFLSVGIVILISIAIALGIVFLLVLIGLLLALRTRRSSEKNTSYPVAPAAASRTSTGPQDRQRPTSLLATLSAATAAVAAADSGKEKMGEKGFGSTVLDPDDSQSIDEDVYGGARRASAGSEDGVEMVRTRYSFEAENDGEVRSFAVCTYFVLC